MLTEEKTKFVIKTLQSKEELSTKELLSAGIDRNDIIKLKKNLVIESSRWGYYKLVDNSKFYELGLDAIKNGDINQAINLMKESIKVGYNIMEATYYLFLLSVYIEDYNEAFKYYEDLYNNPNDIISKEDLNFYLYVLNFITMIPDKYYEFVRFMNIKNTGSVNEGSSINDDIKVKFFNRRYLDSLRLIDTNQSFSNYVLSKMIRVVMDNLNEERKKQIELIKSKKFNELYNYFIDIKSYRNLENYECMALEILESILNMLDNKSLPNVNYELTSSLNTAIRNKNFKLALKLSKEFNERNRSDLSNNHIYLLLVSINDIIQKLENNQLEEINKIKILEREGITYQGIVNAIERVDAETLKNEIKHYLSLIGASKYEFLFNDLISLDVSNMDKLFSKTMLKLSLLHNGNYNFDISEYVMSFYECISLKKFNEARIYLDIMNQAVKNGLTTLSVFGFDQILEKSIRNNEGLFSGVLGYKPVVKKKYTFEDLGIGYTMDDLISNKLLLLSKNVDFSYIKEVCNYLDDVQVFLIDVEGEKRIILKYSETEKDAKLSLK